MPKSKKKIRKKKIVEKPVLPWQKETPVLEEKFQVPKIIPKQEKLAKGWRKT